MKTSVLVASLALSSVLPSCKDATAEVSLYVALDQEHSERLVDLFEKETGIRVNARFDSESNKTVGLVSAIVEEANHPRCDVFWNNELAHTVRLAQKGLIAPYVSSVAAKIPAQYRDAAGQWTGFAARARVIIVNPPKLGTTDRAQWPKSILDFADPKWKGRCAIARPLTGTTLTHFAALRLAMGKDAFDRWLAALEANEVIWLQSNGATMKETANPSSACAFALTDTDDFHVALTKGDAVDCVFPDQADGELGTMLIPNSIAIIKGGPNPEAAKKLVDFVLSERLEGMLAAAKSAQIPLRAEVPGPKAASILPVNGFKHMQWDPVAVAGALDEAIVDFTDRFQSGK